MKFLLCLVAMVLAFLREASACVGIRIIYHGEKTEDSQCSDPENQLINKALHAEIFEERNEDFDQSVQVAMSRRDPSQMEGFKARTREILPPIAQEVQTKEQDLTGEYKRCSMIRSMING